MRLLAAVLAQPRVRALTSDEHFSVDGTLIQAWASHKSLQPKPGSEAPTKGKDGPTPPSATSPGRNAERDWRGQKRSNNTHQSTTDPDARLARKADGQPSILAYAGHILVENRNGLVVGATLTRATGTAEREAALALVDRLRFRRPCTRGGRLRRITLGADKNYDAAAFVADPKRRRVSPHVARHSYTTKRGKTRRSAIPERATFQPGYKLSQRARKRIEEVFGSRKRGAFAAGVKVAAGLRRTRHRGRERVGWCFALATTAYNLVRLPKLPTTPA